jgi:NAD(P)-dependent dehydrogenase (short-subunit alcohol dehydrogenase family)
MELAGKVIVVTGGASGIGRGLAERFAREGARAIVVADRDGEGAESVARSVNDIVGAQRACAVPVDVAAEEDMQRLVRSSIELFGGIDLFCSNAGIFVAGGEEVPDAEWRRIFDVNVMAHVYAARAVVPTMLARGSGYFLCTVSAAGLLSQIGSAPYAVTKHAALAFAEWLAITHGARGLTVSCLCPQGVRTGMLNESSGPSFLLEGALTPEEVADATVQGLRDERFLILPHPEVASYFQRKAADYDRWLRGMRRLAERSGS